MPRLRAARAALVLLLLLGRLAGAQDNVFAPYLTDQPPTVVQIVSREVQSGVEVTRLKFLARRDERTGRDVVICAYLTRPTTPGPHPGILVCHGGGGYAEQVAPQAIGWAEQGYVSVCQDQPGIYTASKGDSSGPNSDPGAGPFKYAGDITDSALYDGVVAALRGLALLRSQPDVDRARIGVTGGSWGGYMTTMVSGLAGDRVKACFAIYGCGFYDHGSTWQTSINALGEAGRQAWLEHLDAGRRATNLSAAYMVATATNDWFFWPSAMMATYGVVAGPKNIVWSPNDSHALNIPGGTASRAPFDHGPHRTWLEQCWLNYHLKGQGQPFPKVVEAGEVSRTGRSVTVEFRVDGTLPLEAGQVWYSAGEMPWRLRWWAQVATETLDYGCYRAVIPIDEPGQPLDWFGTVSDNQQRGASSLIRTVPPLDPARAAAAGAGPRSASTSRTRARRVASGASTTNAAPAGSRPTGPRPARAEWVNADRPGRGGVLRNPCRHARPDRRDDVADGDPRGRGQCAVPEDRTAGRRARWSTAPLGLGPVAGDHHGLLADAVAAAGGGEVPREGRAAVRAGDRAPGAALPRAGGGDDRLRG